MVFRGSVCRLQKGNPTRKTMGPQAKYSKEQCVSNLFPLFGSGDLDVGIKNSFNQRCRHINEAQQSNEPGPSMQKHNITKAFTNACIAEHKPMTL